MEKVIRIFDSFEEADAEDALSRAKMSPQERVDIFFELRERAHPEAFKQGIARVCRVLELEQS
jgi:hypothetical protein